MAIEKDQAISKHADKLHHPQMDGRLTIPPTSMENYKLLHPEEEHI
jgi:hypothetical protein